DTQERKTRAQPFKDIVARGERLRRQMVTRARPECMGSKRAATRPGRSPDDRRALVIWLEGMHLRARARFALRPRPVEGASVARRIELFQKAAIGGNRLFDEITRRGLEDGAALCIVGSKQLRAAPALQHGGKLPAQIACVLKPGVDAIPTVGRMAVGRIAGDEDAAGAIGIRDRKTEIPKADVIELHVELRAGRGIEMLAKVEIVPGRAIGDRSVKKPGGAEVHAAKELPVALKFRVENAVEGLAGIALQQAVQGVRTK